MDLKKQRREDLAVARLDRIEARATAIIAAGHTIHFTGDDGNIAFLEANSLVLRAYDVAEIAERERARRIQIGMDAVEADLTARGFIEAPELVEAPAADGE